MIILNQNKTEVINFDNIQKLSLVEKSNGVIIAASYIDGSVNQIAEYSNVESGKKILNEIFTGYRGSASYCLPADKEVSKCQEPAPHASTTKASPAKSYARK